MMLFTMEPNKDPKVAFSHLLDTLDMQFVGDEDTEFVVKEDSKSGELAIYEKRNNGDLKKYDDRGTLFVALRNVAVCLYGNVSFRSDDYIYNYDR